MDTRTGEVLALADYPTFDATEPLDSPEDGPGLRALSDVYEPGSVQKVLTVASLIDAGPGHARAPRSWSRPQLARQDRRHPRLVHPRHLRLTLAGVIAKSSNIGTVLATDTMAPAKLGRYLRGFGLGRRTDVGVLGESAGCCPPEPR